MKSFLQHLQESETPVDAHSEDRVESGPEDWLPEVHAQWCLDNPGHESCAEHQAMFEQQDIYGNRKEPWKPDPERAHQMREKRAKREGWTTGDTDAAAENRKRRDANQQKAYDRYLKRRGGDHHNALPFDLWKARQRDRASLWHNPNTIIPQRSEDGKLIKPNTTLPDGSRLLNPYNPDDLTTDRGTANPEAAKRVRDEMRKNSPRGLGGPDSPDKW